jgi:hypothetical protein
MTTETIIAISALAYLITGMAFAVMMLMVNGEPSAEDRPLILALVLFWPVFAAVYLPLFAARWIKARRAARREKPKAFEEYEP